MGNFTTEQQIEQLRNGGPIKQKLIKMTKKGIDFVEKLAAAGKMHFEEDTNEDLFKLPKFPF